jgi:RecA-family ATPase
VELDGGDYNLEYLVEGALVKGQPCIVAGGRKSLKTSLIIDMGIALCTGGYSLGKLQVKRPVRVGILSGESGMATIQETARRVC